MTTFVCRNNRCPYLLLADGAAFEELSEGYVPTDDSVRKAWSVRFENDGTGEQVRPGERTTCAACGEEGQEEE